MAVCKKVGAGKSLEIGLEFSAADLPLAGMLKWWLVTIKALKKLRAA